MNPKHYAAALAALCWAGPALAATAVSRIPGPDAGGAAYVSSDLGGGCTLGIEFERPSLLVFFRKVPECDQQLSGKAQIAAVARDLLAAATKDGQDLRRIALINPTAVLQRDWIQNFIDCYAGADLEADSREAMARLKNCDIAPELSGPFAEIGVTIRFESGQEPFGFDCEKLEGYTEYFDPAWLQKYRNRHCKLNIPTKWWLKASPT